MDQENHDYLDFENWSTLNSIDQVTEALYAQGYLSNTEISTTVFLAILLKKPILIEGPAGTGKTELAKALSKACGAELIRLQCYEGLDDAKAIYEWNYSKQLLRIQAARDQNGQGAKWEDLMVDIFTEDYLLARPILQSISGSSLKLLLIDEIDRVEIETEALFLEVLSDFQVSIPEFGTIEATTQPIVILTSNNTRDLSEALKRRCLFLHLDYPTTERERDILTMKVPNLDLAFAQQIAELLGMFRSLDFRKNPSISEAIDWARTLLALGARELDPKIVVSTLNVLLKYQSDIDKALARFK